MTNALKISKYAKGTLQINTKLLLGTAFSDLSPPYGTLFTQ